MVACSARLVAGISARRSEPRLKAFAGKRRFVMTTCAWQSLTSLYGSPCDRKSLRTRRRRDKKLALLLLPAGATWRAAVARLIEAGYPMHEAPRQPSGANLDVCM